MFGKLMNKAKSALKETVPIVNVSIQGPKVPPKPAIGINVHAPQITTPTIGLNVQAPTIGISTHFDYKIPESAHAHPLIFEPHLNGECKNCRINVSVEGGYRCGACDVVLCYHCSNRIFYGNKNSMEFENCWLRQTILQFAEQTTSLILNNSNICCNKIL